LSYEFGTLNRTFTTYLIGGAAGTVDTPVRQTPVLQAQIGHLNVRLEKLRVSDRNELSG